MKSDTERKRDLTHCKVGDDNRLTSALSSSGTSSSLETQLIFVIMPHPHLSRHSCVPPVKPLQPSSSSPRAATRFLFPRYLRSPVEERRFNEISCHLRNLSFFSILTFSCFLLFIALLTINDDSCLKRNEISGMMSFFYY